MALSARSCVRHRRTALCRPPAARNAQSAGGGGLGALALLGLLEPVTGIALPLNRFTAFCAGVLGLPGVTALLILRLLL